MASGTRAPSTIVTVPLNGQTDFNIPFEYLARKFVVVTLLGIDRKVLTLNSDYRFVSKTTISLANPTPAGYTQLELRRVTSATERLVDFHDGSILRAHDLNISQIQTLHVAEEARNYVATDGISMDDDGNLDARLRKVVNVAYAQNGGDAVPYGQLVSMENGAYQSALSAAASASEAARIEQRLKATLDSFVSILAFGAVGDGITDDSDAVEAAARSGVAVYWPRKVFKVTRGISTTVPITWFSEGARLELSGVAAGETHIATTESIYVRGIHPSSASRGAIFRVTPIDGIGVDYVIVEGSSFSGGFYSVRAGVHGEVSQTARIRYARIDGCRSTAPTGNSGHFFMSNADIVKYVNSDVKGGTNTAAFGAAHCLDYTVSGCSESGVAQTGSGVEAACQLEDSPDCKAKIYGNNFEHDIWIASSSGANVFGNSCRELRVTTGSRYTRAPMRQIVFCNNDAKRFNVQKYGSYDNDQKASVMLDGNTFDPAAGGNLGNPYASTYIIQGSVCELLELVNNRNISDAVTSAIQVTRSAGLRMVIGPMNEFGSKPHNVSGAAGNIVSSLGVDNPIMGQGTTYVSDMLLGFSSGTSTAVPTSTGDIAFTSVAKNFNNEYTQATNQIAPFEDRVYAINGTLGINADQDGRRVTVQLINTTDNIVVQTLANTKLWSGLNAVNLLTVNVKLFAGKVYKLRISSSGGCTYEGGLSNTAVSLKVLI